MSIHLLSPHLRWRCPHPLKPHLLQRCPSDRKEAPRAATQDPSSRGRDVPPTQRAGPLQSQGESGPLSQSLRRQNPWLRNPRSKLRPTAAARHGESWGPGLQAAPYSAERAIVGENVREAATEAMGRAKRAVKVKRVESAGVGVRAGSSELLSTAVLELVARTAPGVLISIGRESRLLAKTQTQRPTIVRHASQRRLNPKINSY